MGLANVSPTPPILSSFPFSSSLMLELTSQETQASEFKFTRARIISKGDPNSKWVRAILPNGEETFLFPDDEETILPKNYSIGVFMFVENPRSCRNPGATKWTTKAMHECFQLPELKQLEIIEQELPVFRPADYGLQAPAPVATEVEQKPVIEKPKKRKSVTATFTPDQIMVLEQIAADQGLEGHYRLSDALKVLVDRNRIV
jgi:hypothetical protein